MNPLDNLLDIENAPAVGSWPPAYGWWVLALFTLLCIWFTTNWLIKYYQKRQLKRLALSELEALNKTQNASIMQLNQLLKRVTMAYFPTVAIQKLHGSQWAEFLVNALPSNQTDKMSDQLIVMQNSLYQNPDKQAVDFAEHKEVVEMWIKQALPPSRKTLQKLEQTNA